MLSFSVQISLDKVVLFSYCLFLKDDLWLLYLSLNVLPACPMYVDSSVSVLTVAMYMIDCFKQWAWSGQVWIPPLQLHSRCWLIWALFCCPIIFLLWPDIIDPMFGRQEYDTFTVFLLKYFPRGEFLKCLSMRDENYSPTLVLTVSK